MKRSRLFCNDSTTSVFKFHDFLNKAFDLLYSLLTWIFCMLLQTWYALQKKIPKGVRIVTLTLRTSYWLIKRRIILCILFQDVRFLLNMRVICGWRKVLVYDSRITVVFIFDLIIVEEGRVTVGVNFRAKDKGKRGVARSPHPLPL